VLVLTRLVSSVAALAAALLLSMPVAARSAEPAPARHTIGGDFMVAIPVGQWADVTGVGFGPLVRYEYRLLPEVAITGRVGFLGHVYKDLAQGFKTRTWEMPILAGARYLSKIGVWGGAELGMFVIGSRTKIPNSVAFFGGDSRTDTGVRFGTVLSGGYRWRGFDAGFSLIVPDIDDFVGFAFTVGYNFLRFGK
jgi:hypothetical protein